MRKTNHRGAWGVFAFYARERVTFTLRPIFSFSQICELKCMVARISSFRVRSFDVELSFVARATLRDSTIGTISCDDKTMLIRGESCNKYLAESNLVFWIQASCCQLSPAGFQSACIIPKNFHSGTYHKSLSIVQT